MSPLLLLAACTRGPGSGVDAPQVDSEARPSSPWGLDERPHNATCAPPPRPVDQTAVVALEPLAGSESYQGIAAVHHDGSWFLVEKEGRILRLDEGVSTLWADLGDRVFAGGERGLLGMAFHPTDPELFLSYTAGDDLDLESRLSRFPLEEGRPDLDAEEPVFRIDQPAKNHNGGRIAFSPDGTLVLGLGDGGGGGAPVHALDPEQLLGKLLRFDVDAARPYAIPEDAPFGNEVLALGLRNPWGWSFDRVTGELWVGDVGWNDSEEVDRVVPGGNYGWPAWEGSTCINEALCDSALHLAPVAEYGHDQGQSITGGLVYRGAAIPALVGSYVFGDYVSGRIWALRFRPEDNQPELRVLLDSGLKISSFAEDEAGELYVVEYGAKGRLHRVVEAGEPEPSEAPEWLSETGCLDSAGLVPYGVIAPLWSDGATKERWVALPDEAVLEVDADGELGLPVGGVLVKSFLVDGERVETRLLARDAEGYFATTWVWEGEDARYTPEGARVGEHIVPARGQCMACHTEASGRVLGLELAQLGLFTYPSGARVEQLPTLQHIGLLPDDLPAFSPLVDPRGEAPVPERARSWLHANCSGCHRPGGIENSELDLRATAEPDLCAPPSLGGGATLVEDIAARAGRRGLGGMPPLATDHPDPEAQALLEQWAASACD